MRLLLTAGPTREPLDPVRYLSNRSTGRVGFAIAEEALRRGHEVQIVLGPVDRPPPAGAELVHVETAEEMLAAVLERLEGSDAVICSAAVADYRPARRRSRKIKHGELKGIELVENPDIAAEVGKRRQERPLCVFALESEDGVANARRKLEEKNADLCVLNAPEAIGASAATFTLVRRDGTQTELGHIDKATLAATLCEELGL